ncbi:fasciclin domain-containing protein [Parafrigoribacterium soli]|uniref:fasciclin domain-containing protein n=1 Tax=Parafrigoribacterium soli TaxID=3144663 RepID=UPI0032EF4B4B
MRVINRSAFAAVTLAAVAVFGLAACSSPASSSTKNKPKSSSSSSSSAMAADPAADLVGSGCAGYASANPDGGGSIKGMSQDLVAQAASNNPLLTTLVAAVSGKLNPDVNLVSTLNGSEFTVFAPVDSAFAKLDPATVDSLKDPANAATLTSILTYHVVPGQIAPDAIDGTQTTVNGATVNVTGSGDNIKVNDANVICGGVHTANATVYLIDSVLMPPAKK